MVERFKPYVQRLIEHPEESEAIPTMPNLLLLGPYGSGKTSTAQGFAHDLIGENWRQFYHEFNASDDRGIDFIRDRIKELARQVGFRILTLDESDALTSDAQWAMRRITERAGTTIFIFTANRESKIFDAIKSRCAIYRFRRLPDDVVAQRLVDVMKGEGLVPTGTDEERKKIREGFDYLVKTSHGDLRLAINTLEKLVTANKKLTVNEVAFLQKSDVASEALKTALLGNFERAKELLETALRNNGSDSLFICQQLYDSIADMSDEDAKIPVKVRLYMKLAETEANLKQNSEPLIQLSGFLAYCWLAPHLANGMPSNSGAK